jgi:hypothetical protein
MVLTSPDEPALNQTVERTILGLVRPSADHRMIDHQNHDRADYGDEHAAEVEPCHAGSAELRDIVSTAAVDGAYDRI